MATPDDPPRFDRRRERALDKAAEISEEDIARAQEAWRETAPRQFRDLLDAAEDDDT